MVHPCGSGAFGFFETTKDVSDLTKVWTVIHNTCSFVLI